MICWSGVFELLTQNKVIVCIMTAIMCFSLFFMQYIYKYLVVRRQRFRIFLNSVISLSSYVSSICNIFMISICLSKLCVLVVHFRSPSQHSEFSNFITNLESTLHSIALKKPFLTMVLGDFNAKNKLWIGQINTTL